MHGHTPAEPVEVACEAEPLGRVEQFLDAGAHAEASRPGERLIADQAEVIEAADRLVDRLDVAAGDEPGQEVRPALHTLVRRGQHRDPPGPGTLAVVEGGVRARHQRLGALRAVPAGQPHRERRQRR